MDCCIQSVILCLPLNFWHLNIHIAHTFFDPWPLCFWPLTSLFDTDPLCLRQACGAAGLPGVRVPSRAAQAPGGAHGSVWRVYRTESSTSHVRARTSRQRTVTCHYVEVRHVCGCQSYMSILLIKRLFDKHYGEEWVIIEVTIIFSL